MNLVFNNKFKKRQLSGPFLLNPFGTKCSVSCSQSPRANLSPYWIGLFMGLTFPHQTGSISCLTQTGTQEISVNPNRSPDKNPCSSPRHVWGSDEPPDSGCWEIPKWHKDERCPWASTGCFTNNQEMFLQRACNVLSSGLGPKRTPMGPTLASKPPCSLGGSSQQGD